jgi:hypothetical protein
LRVCFCCGHVFCGKIGSDDFWLPTFVDAFYNTDHVGHGRDGTIYSIHLYLYHILYGPIHTHTAWSCFIHSTCTWKKAKWPPTNTNDAWYQMLLVSGVSESLNKA